MSRIASSQARKRVTIKGGKVDPIVYEKPDYVKCTKTQPKAKVHYRRSENLLIRFAKMTSGHTHVD